ncbi:MAG: GMC family oxidoreductase [Acidobacteria bacterium]|nr:GMC family oxidoreductase [Acidobacteriota bacterium]
MAVPATAVGMCRLVDTALAQQSGTANDRTAVVSALGNTLIPSAAGDPGYKHLEPYGITKEVLKNLAELSDADLRMFNENSKSLFEGQSFLGLDEKRRADYVRLIIDGSKFQDKSVLNTLQDTYRTIRRSIVRLFYSNFPENNWPRDSSGIPDLKPLGWDNGIPLLKPGDLHQITNPNTKQLVTGWDIARKTGTFSWEEEEEKRKYYEKLDWKVEPGDAKAPVSGFEKQEDFTKAIVAAHSNKGNSTARYDVIIAGGGHAGCILAARIAEKGINPKNGERLKVAMIEWGPYLKGDPMPGSGHPLRRLVFNSEREFVVNGRKDRLRPPWFGAKVVGGSSVHYGALAPPVMRRDFLHWQNETGLDWTEEEFKEPIREVVEMFNIHPMPDAMLTEGQRLWGQAAKKLGYSPQRFPHARRNCLHCGVCEGGGEERFCKYDAKIGSNLNYVPIAERNGVEIIPNTRVEKVILEKRGSDFFATGVWAEQDGKKVQFFADKVIVSAGTNGTPVILYNSGYGPKDLLGTELIVENPNVGRHVDGRLYGPRFSALFPFPIKQGDRGMARAYFMTQGGDKDWYDWLLFREGTSGAEYPGTMALSEFAPEFGLEHKQFMKTRGDQLATDVVLNYCPKNAMEGRIARNGRSVPLSIKDPYSAKRLIEGIEITRDIYREMGATRIQNVDRSLKQLRDVQSGKEGFNASPGAGSCRAGKDRGNSVVDERFESHDIRNLFVCDRSVAPRDTLGDGGTNCVAPIACLAWRRIVKDHFSKA